MAGLPKREPKELGRFDRFDRFFDDWVKVLPLRRIDPVSGNPGAVDAARGVVASAERRLLLDVARAQDAGRTP